MKITTTKLLQLLVCISFMIYGWQCCAAELVEIQLEDCTVSVPKTNYNIFKEVIDENKPDFLSERMLFELRHVKKVAFDVIMANLDTIRNC